MRHLIILACLCLALSSCQLKANILGAHTNISPAEIISLVNLERTKAGLNPLHPDPLLENAATEKAIDIITNDYWAHYSSKGAAPWDFILNQGYVYSYAGENLARNFATSQKVVEAWIDSVTHKDNMLFSNYEDIGVAIKESSGDQDTSIVIVMLLAKKGEINADTQYRVTPMINPIPTIWIKTSLFILITSIWIGIFRLLSKQFKSSRR